MNRAYTLGIATMAGVWALVLAFALHHLPGVAMETPRVIFRPEIVEEQNYYLLPGQERIFRMQLRNANAGSVNVSAISISPSYGFVAMPNAAQFPLQIARGAEVPLEIAVELPPDYQFSGKLALRVDAICGGRDTSAIGSAHLVLQCAQRLNAEPRVVSFGAIRRGSTVKAEKVRLWHPTSAREPTNLRADVGDPAISATIGENREERDGRSYFCELSVSVDPQVAGARFREDIALFYDGGELRVPIVGWATD